MNRPNGNAVVVDSRGADSHVRAFALHHAEKILTEIPNTLRRIALLLLVLAISIPTFMVGLLVVLWHLRH